MATAPPRPDAVLIRRLRERDRTAWEELYAEYGPRLHGFAYRLAGNEHDAADLVQETFVRALPRLDRLDPETTQLGPYLFTTLRNLFLKGVERTKRVQPVEEVPEPRSPAPIEDDPERSTLLHRQQEEVRVANARLPQRQRLVLALRELEDKSYAEIGELVGLKENAVAQLVFRARESLRTELRLAQVDPERLPEPCRSYLPLLAAHLDAQLKGARRDEVLAHLEGCETCQAALESMDEARRRYRTILLPLASGEETARAAEHELDVLGYWTTPVPPPRPGAGRRARRAALVVAGALVLGAGGLGTAALLDREELEAAPAATTSAPVEQPAPPASPPPPPTPPPPPATQSARAGVTVVLEPLTSPPPPPASTDGTTETVATTAPTTTTAPATRTAPTTARRGAPKPKAATTPAAKPKPKPPAKKPAVTQPATTATAPGTTATEPVTTAPPPPPADTTAPTVTISSGPPATTTSTSATFVFSASEAATFACALDGAPATACASPASYSNLAIGSHSFAVQATDAAGNTGPAATHAWKVEQGFVLVLPDLVIASLTKNSVIVKNVGNGTAGASTLSVTLIGTFSIEPLAPGQSTTRTWSVCRVGTITARADRGDDVTESNESNNAASVVSTCP
jgi:RNA polymerase sigma factor (sigma-70 family)